MLRAVGKLRGKQSCSHFHVAKEKAIGAAPGTEELGGSLGMLFLALSQRTLYPTLWACGYEQPLRLCYNPYKPNLGAH